MDLSCDHPGRLLTDAGGKRRLIREGGSITRISNDCGPQFPVGDGITCPAAQDEIVSRVGAARHLETVVPLGGAVLDDIRQLCSDSEASDDGLLLVGVLAPMNGTDVCCARLDDFDWVVPNRVPDIFTSDRHMEVYLSDLSHDQKFCRMCFRSCLPGRLLCRCPCLWLLRQCPRLYLERRPLLW